MTVDDVAAASDLRPLPSRPSSVNFLENYKALEIAACFEAFPQPLLLVNCAGEVLTYNELLSDLLLINETDVKRVSLEKIFGVESTRIIKRLIADLVAAPSPGPISLVVKQKIPGRMPRRQLDLSLFVSIPRRGASIIGILVNEKVRHQASLRKSERFFRLSSEVSSDYVFSYRVNKKGEHALQWMAGAFQKITGYRSAQIMTKAGWIRLMHPDDRKEIKIFSAKLNQNIGGTLVHRIVTRAGETRWLKIVARPYFDLSLDRVTEIFGSAQDITESKLAEHERLLLLHSERSARAQAEKANREKEEFLAFLSHELRGPLNSMLGWSKLLKNPNLSKERSEMGLDIIERSARTQSVLIDDLLNISQLSAGKISLLNEAVELCGLLKTCTASFQPLAESKRIFIRTELNNSPLYVQGDAARLHQIIGNLLTNAFKFTPPDGTVEVKAAKFGSTLHVSIKDSGRGIEREFLPFVFDRFKQSSQSTTKRYGGLGLGLAIVKELVQLHGGTVKALSEGKDKGAEFIIELPLETSNDHSYSNSDLIHQECLHAKHILVVEDEPDSISLVRRILEEHGAKVDVALSVDEALKYLSSKTPDLIVSDISMPDKDGFDLIREVRQKYGEAIKLVALTAFGQDQDRKRSIDAGYCLHFGKPIDAIQLVRGIAGLIHPL